MRDEGMTREFFEKIRENVANYYRSVLGADRVTWETIGKEAMLRLDFPEEGEVLLSIEPLSFQEYLRIDRNIISIKQQYALSIGRNGEGPGEREASQGLIEDIENSF